MKTLAERLKFARENLSLSQQEVAKLAGISQPTYFKIENGLTLKPRNILDIAKALKVRADWLATGQGQMTTTAFDPTKLKGYSRIDDWDDDTPLDDDEVAIKFYKSLAFACGNGAEYTAYEDEWHRLRFSRITLDRMGIYKDKTFAATAHENSMMPTICSGDTIFVDMSRDTIKDGKIFAIEHGGLFYCKRLYKLPNGGVRIVSDNKNEFPERELNADEIVEQQFKVIGWVFSVSRLERWY